MMNQQKILTNSYISKKTQKKKYEWYEHDLMTYIDDLKCENFVLDMDSHFSRAKVVNFDIIHHQCCGDKLNNPEEYYQTIYDKDFVNYENHLCNEAVLSAIKSECNNIRFERDFVNRHIKRDVEKDLISNGIFIKEDK